MTRNTDPTNHPARRIALLTAATFLLTTTTAAAMSLAIAVALTGSLAVLAAVVVTLNRTIRGDGYGQRQPPRSLADDGTHTKTLTRLAR